MIKADPWPHQYQLVDFATSALDKLGYVWWLAGAGTGKTLSTYMLINSLRVNKTLILTKKTIINQAWVGNAQRFTEGFEVVPLTKGSSADKYKQLRGLRGTNNLVVVVNYETASILSQELGAYGFDLVVADESHWLKSHNSGVSKKLGLAANGIPYKVAMTGTGWDDRPTDVYGQVRYLSGAYKGAGGSVISRRLGSWTSFFDTYVNYWSKDNIKIPISYKNQDQLRRIIDPFTMYLKSEDVLTLPPEVDIDWTVEWTPELRRTYRELEKDLLTTYDGDVTTADNVLTLALRLHQLTGGYLQGSSEGRYVATPKVDATLDILDEIGGLPTVIFTVFETDVQQLKPRLEEAGHEVLVLTGQLQQHEEFQAGRGDVIIVNLAAGSAGVELTRARYAIYYSIGTSRTNYVQSRYRVRRPSSDLAYPITYYHLLLPNSVDVDLHDAMYKKGTYSNKLLEGLVNVVT